MHAALEQQLKIWVVKKQQGASILKDMQNLFHDEFRRAYGWDSSEPHFLYPPEEDPALLIGRALLNASRATAIVFWEHQQAGHTAHHTEQLTPELEITSMPVHTRAELDIVRAKKGMTLMLSYGNDLRSALLDTGLLYRARCDDGQERTYVKQREIRKTLVDIAHITTCKNEVDMAGFRRVSGRKFCNCICYARYGCCGHLKFLSWTASHLNTHPAPGPLNTAAAQTRSTARFQNCEETSGTVGRFTLHWLPEKKETCVTFIGSSNHVHHLVFFED